MNDRRDEREMVCSARADKARAYVCEIHPQGARAGSGGAADPLHEGDAEREDFMEGSDVSRVFVCEV